MLATAQRHHDCPILPPIRATIVAGNNDVGIRISDQGVYLTTLPIRPSTTQPQAGVFLFLKLNHRLTCSRFPTSETLHGWRTLGLGRCAE